MSQALLIQTFDVLKTASIIATGSTPNILNLKLQAENDTNKLIQSGEIHKYAPQNTKLLYPKFHVIIANPQSIQNIANHFNHKEINKEIYQLVHNLALIDHY